MDSSLENLKAAFDSFFEGDAKVALIKGEWGVGKTHFWEQYIASKLEANTLAQLAYSYVSLFGRNSLDDVKKSIFHNAKGLKTLEVIEEEFEKEEVDSTWLYKRIPYLKDGMATVKRNAGLLGKLTKNTQELPFIGKVANFASRFEYGFVKNYIVCFDDLERKGKGLTIREFMGLVDELAQRKNCKVVIIFNERSYEENDSEFEDFQSYREKVVDLELYHKPSSRSNLEHVFSKQYVGYGALELAVTVLDVKNIRVLRKIKWMLEKFEPFTRSIHDSLREEFYMHAVVLCSEYYIRQKELPYEEFKSKLEVSSWRTMKTSGADESAADRRFGDIITKLQLSGSAFDCHIDFFLEHGYVEQDRLILTIQEVEEGRKAFTAGSELNKAWELYSEGFEDNLELFLSSLRSVIDQNITRISLSDFSSVIETLDDFGESVTSYIERFVEGNRSTFLSDSKKFAWSLRRVRNTELANALRAELNVSVVFDLDTIAKRIADNNGWKPGDVDYLDSLRVKDYKDWMKASNNNIYYKIVSGLFIFNGLHSASNDGESSKYSSISIKVDTALREIGAENKYNGMRVRNLYKIDIDPSSH